MGNQSNNGLSEGCNVAWSGSPESDAGSLWGEENRLMILLEVVDQIVQDLRQGDEADEFLACALQREVRIRLKL